MERYCWICLGALLLTLAAVNSARADGLIIPILPPGEVRVPPLTIKYHHVTVKITDQVAVTKVDQVFLNEYHRDLEGTYIFPLPKGANITEFAMYINGERMTAELLDKAQARKIYEDIVRQMKDPALLEYADRDLFKIRIYPIPAHGEKRIQLEYSEVLKNDSGLVRYHYPLNTERFSAKPLQDVTITVDLTSQQPIKSVYSPSHDLATKIPDSHTAHASYEATHVLPDKDFILYYTLSAQDLGVNLLTYKTRREDGYFLLMLAPGAVAEKQPVLPKDIVFVLDTSGSMQRDGKIRQAQEALIYGIEGLRPTDRFGVVTFSTSVNIFAETLQPASKANLNDAVSFVEDLQARGGTDIYEALRAALQLFDAASDRPQMIAFMTDGLPTVGMTDYAQILKEIAQQNTHQRRIFTFGVGYDVNTHLLDTLAEESNAASAYIEPEQDIEVVVSAFFDKIESPVLAQLELNIAGAGLSDLFPKTLPDLFRGSQVLVFGRYREPGQYRLTLSGMMHDQKQTYTSDVALPELQREHDFLPRLWASRKVGYLLDQIRLHGEEPELKDEVMALAKKFGIVTPYTSYLVVEDDGERQPRRQTSDRLNEPAPAAPQEGRGMARELYHQLEKKADVTLPSAYRNEQAGKAAVQISKDVKRQKEQNVTTESAAPDIRYIGTKTFYLLDGVWTDSAYAAGAPAHAVAYSSAAYFKLLEIVPEIGQYLALGEQVVVCLEEQTCVKIGPDGITETGSPEFQKLLEQL